MISTRRVVIVTSVPEERETLTNALRDAGFRVHVTESLQDDLSADLAFVDVTDDRHWPLAERFRASRLILITDSAEALSRGFEMGADDCVMVDAHPSEVVARCDAVLRRTSDRPDGGSSPPSVYVDRLLWVNFGSRQVWVGETPARLTPREFRLLRHLVRHRDETLSHEALLTSVWERSLDNERPAEVLKQYIWRLRQKIEADPDAPEIIVTDPGKGYRFVSHFA